MGSHRIADHADATARNDLVQALLDDLDTLQTMLDEGVIEDGPARIGAEQELAIVDAALNPAPLAEQILAELGSKRYTTELGRFTLEVNASPRLLRSGCFAEMQTELLRDTTAVRDSARAAGADLVLVGIVPTFEPSDATLDQMTPCDRYDQLNSATIPPRSGLLPIHISGIDELKIWHDNIVVEACATSFQVHLQISPAQFANAYNASLLCAAPLLAACANSPMLAGRRLWHETRIPLLESCADIRNLADWRRGGRPRTSLGDGWVESSIVEVFHRDLGRFPSIFGPAELERSSNVLRSGQIPALRALTTFNGTVWRWIRPCYGVTEGRPHLRLENRLLPSGPTLQDEIANAAFWVGMMLSLPQQYGDFRSRLAFEDAEANLRAAARAGLNAELRWLDGRRLKAATLILNELLPLARQGLRQAGLRADEIAEQLDVIHQRVLTGRTGAAWALELYDRLGSDVPRRERAWRVASSLVRHCWGDSPVHQWSDRAPGIERQPSLGVVVESNVCSLDPTTPLALARFITRTQDVHQIAVEDVRGQLVGILAEADLVGDGTVGAAVQGRPHPPQLDPTDSVEHALMKLRQADADFGIVCRGNFLAGVVRQDELVRIIETYRRPDESPDVQPLDGIPV